MADSELQREIGIESDVVELLPEPALARARLRIDNSEARGQPFPEGRWLTVKVSTWLFEPTAAQEGRFDEPIAAGPEIDAVARAGSWTYVDLPLPYVFRREYLLMARVFSADPDYPRLFSPSRCRVYRATFGNVLRVEKTVLDDVYEHRGYGNPGAEAELRRWVQEGAVVVEDEGRLFRAVEGDGGRSVRYEPFTAS